ncbi:helix-turn-helix domain-containing protein [Duganella sp. FT92W]|uniref:Helix-turn-helix domain-containing protein n=1 Tax=Pseudoduganella rivuli TaxID=2666085 RepID=A0A7X2IJA4_9BURK|nr:IclR family transcriptional regulator [Pseudoduganella rivuli]MRV70508.1 helix-turn-helix domain-containing protein [Pseudoduganella rivuli]
MKPAPAPAAQTEPAPAHAATITMVKPVINALHILRHLASAGEPARAIDIARLLGINQSTCFNILRTLVAEDVLAFDPLSKTYTASIGLVNLVGQFITQGQRLEVAKPLMRELAREFAVTVTLWRPIGTDRIVLVSSETSPTDVSIDMAEGQRLPYLMGASGRVFAGQLGWTEQQMRATFEQIRWSEPLTFDAYWREVLEAKKRGYAIDDGNFARGILAVAAPVRDANGTIVFTVSGVMFRNQYDKAGVATVGKALNALGNKLSTLLFNTNKDK